MLDIKKIEEELNCELSIQKINEINSLEDHSNEIRRPNLIGKKFNRLLVIAKGPNYVSPGGARQGQWWCICSCDAHNIILARTCNLQSGNSKSCNCLNMEKITERMRELGKKSAVDITNKKFGFLTALEPTEERKGRSVIWKCLCDCGNIHYAPAKELNRLSVTSCGCLKESKGSIKIKELLTLNNIKYIPEKTFTTCKFPDTNASARFDFYLPDYNILIEYDGEQHFEEKDLNYFRDSLEKRQMHDEFKTNWCKDNNISLIRIPYYELDNITINTLLNK